MDDLTLTPVTPTPPGSLTLKHELVEAADGYRLSPVVADGVVQPGKYAHTWDGDATQHRFAAGHAPYTVEALAVIARGIYPAGEGTTRFAYPGQLRSTIAQCKDGDSVIAVGGIHPATTLDRSFSITKRVSIGCDSTSLVRGLNTGGQRGYRFLPVGHEYAFHSQVPVSLGDVNATPFYAAGDCDVIVGGLLEGGYDGVKQYCSGGGGLVVLDGVIAQGNGGDCCHVNGAKYFEARNYFGRNPIDDGREHHDGLQVEYADHVKLGPNFLVTWRVMPRRDEPNNGLMLQGETGSGIGLLEIDGVTVDGWWGGRGFQLTAAKRAIVRNLVVRDSGDGRPYPGPGSPPITLAGVKGAGMVYDLYGVDKSQVYENNQYAQITYHPA